MNAHTEKNQITLFRDPLDPRELSLSQQHEGLTHTLETGNPRIPQNQFMKNENNILAGERTQETAVLKVRVKRSPPSLAGYFYHIEPGKRVYILDRYERNGVPCAIVATMPKDQCVSEDYFRVKLSSLEIAL